MESGRSDGNRRLPAGAAGGALLDEAVVAVLRGLAAQSPDHDWIHGALGTFEREAASRVRELRDAVAAADAGRVAAAAHAFAGTGASFGARAVAQNCVEIERMARAEELGSVPGAVDRLSALTGDTVQRLRHVLSEPAEQRTSTDCRPGDPA